MALTTESLAILKARFAVEDHEFLSKGDSEVKFVYITERAITERIEEVDPAWEFNVQEVNRQTLMIDKFDKEKKQTVTKQYIKVSVVASLTIGGVTRTNTGEEIERGDNESIKSATTDALKRCARLFGIGRYLLDTPKWVNNQNDLAKWFGGNASAPQSNNKSKPAPEQSTQAPPRQLPDGTFLLDNVTKITRVETAKGGTMVIFGDGDNSATAFDTACIRLLGLETEPLMQQGMMDLSQTPIKVIYEVDKTGKYRNAIRINYPPMNITSELVNKKWQLKA